MPYAYSNAERRAEVIAHFSPYLVAEVTERVDRDRLLRGDNRFLSEYVSLPMFVETVTKDSGEACVVELCRIPIEVRVVTADSQRQARHKFCGIHERYALGKA